MTQYRFHGLLIIDRVTYRHSRKSGGERIVVGTLYNVAGIRAPVVMVLRIKVQRRCHFFFGDLSPFLESRVNVRWKGP